MIIIAYDNVAERREVFRESEASLKTNRGKRESPCFLCPIRFRLAETFRLRRKGFSFFSDTTVTAYGELRHRVTTERTAGSELFI